MSSSSNTLRESGTSTTDSNGNETAGSPSPLKGVASLAATPRVVSMDQYRGYCVAGMFVVNFLGAFDVTHQFLKHNGTHFSWADSIMPGFIFAAGFSFRLSVLKRIQRFGRGKTYLGVVKRSLALVLLSLMIYGLGGGFDNWGGVNSESSWKYFTELLKADLWEVLAIIGVLQLLLLPIIETGPVFRLIATVGCSVGHILISASFNYWFVYGQPNWMEGVWGLEGRRAWDGGFFGLISWAIAMLAGTLVYDLMVSRSAAKTVRPLFVWGGGLMFVGYAMYCLTTLYDVTDAEAIAAYEAGVVNAEAKRVAEAEKRAFWESDPEPLTEEQLAKAAEARSAAAEKDNYKKYASELEQLIARRAKERAEADKPRVIDKVFAESPVIPPFENASGRSFTSLLAEPPFFVPRPDALRKKNYWSMDKRMVTQSFILFATGFSIAVYALFVLACDTAGWSIGLFRTFGQNALAAYVLHGPVEHSIQQLVPDDSPAWWVTVGFVIFFTITYFFCRFLEKNKLYLKL